MMKYQLVLAIIAIELFYFVDHSSGYINHQVVDNITEEFRKDFDKCFKSINGTIVSSYKEVYDDMKKQFDDLFHSQNIKTIVKSWKSLNSLFNTTIHDVHGINKLVNEIVKDILKIIEV